MKNTKTLLLLAFCQVILFACADRQELVPPPVRPVKYQELEYVTVHKSFTFSGSAQMVKIVNLSFRNTGIITELNIGLGQEVRKGQLLAKLDNVQSRLAYEQALTQVNSTKSQMNTMKLNLNRVRSLYEKGSASLSDFENAKNGYKTAQQGYQSAKRGLDIQAEQIKYGYIYAPVDGTIASVSSDVDENVSAGDVIATLNAGKTMEIVLGLPEIIINSISEDMPVDIRFPALEGQVFKGKVKQVSPSANASTSTYPVKVSILDPTDMIKSGMAADVTFQLTTEQTALKSLIVPTNVVGEDSNGKYVFVLIGKGDTVTVQKQKVTIGQLSTRGFEIVEGLQAGDKIATAGLQTLLNGQKVRLSK